jgi:predicted nucleic acid-binding protein
MNCMSDEQQTFFDTNMLVYAHDRTAGNKHAAAQELVRSAWDAGGACLSVQVLQEFYVTVTRKVDGMTRPIARDLVEDYSRWQVHRPAAEDVVAAIDLHQRNRISFLDAMIVRSAGKLGCRRLLTEDLNAGQSFAGVRVVNPFIVAQ